MLERRRVLGRGPGLLFKCPRTISTSNGYHSQLPHSCQLEPRQKYSPDEPRDSGDEELLTSPLSHRHKNISGEPNTLLVILRLISTLGHTPIGRQYILPTEPPVSMQLVVAGRGGDVGSVLMSSLLQPVTRVKMVRRSAARICVCVGGCSLGPPPAPCQSHTDKYVVHRQHTPAQVARWGRLIFLNMSAALIIFYTL